MPVHRDPSQPVSAPGSASSPAPTSGPPIIPADAVVWREHLPGGAHWSWILRRGQRLRLIDVPGGANVSALFCNAAQPLERFNLPDTLKAQFTAFLTAPLVLFSDLGRILCSITADTCGWHDVLAGCSTTAGLVARHGRRDYQDAGNGMLRGAEDGLLIELGKHGLGRRDLGPTLNLFSKVAVDDHGRMAFVPGHSRAGATVDLRAEMDVLVALSAAPHPLDPSPVYAPPGVELCVWRGPARATGDPSRIVRAENDRGFALTDAVMA